MSVSRLGSAFAPVVIEGAEIAPSVFAVRYTRFRRGCEEGNVRVTRGRVSLGRDDLSKAH